MEREVNRFRAVSDDGQDFTVIEYQGFTESRDLDGSVSIIEGLKRFVLRNGASVNQIDTETFKIVQTNKIIRKVR